MEINKKTIQEQRRLLVANEIQPIDLLEAVQKSYESQKDLNAYLEFFEDAKDQAKAIPRINAESPNLMGIPGGIKDNIAIKDRHMSCASRMLENYISPYNATVVESLDKQGFVNTGRLNHDEFAIGASGAYSAFGPTLNPLDKERFCGGSSSGSAVCVAAGMASFALGTDTGGSSRLPASYCGIYGFKPTYGAISRYGVAEYAPSLDTVGILARCPADIEIVFDVITGEDVMDETTQGIARQIEKHRCMSFKGLKVAIFEKLLQRTHPSVQAAFQKAYDCLKHEGAQFKSVDLGMEDILLSVYYITACSEAASSLSRYDGARYGFCPDFKGKSIEELYCEARTQGLGHEVQRRILLGNYFLSEKNYNQWYGKASSMRRALIEKADILAKEGYDIYLLPGFNEAQPINASEEDTYASDLVGVFANLMGVPALCLPLHSGDHGLPVSFQLSGARGSDRKVLDVGEQLHQRLNSRS
ncbi:MAG: amidase family protein [Spirochaetia bacterium]